MIISLIYINFSFSNINMSIGEGYKRNNKKKRGIGIVITIWHGMTIQGLYCYLDMGNNTVMYHKCSHVPNLISGETKIRPFNTL